MADKGIKMSQVDQNKAINELFPDDKASIGSSSSGFKDVTDPDVLKKLNAPSESASDFKDVTDPDILKQLNGAGASDPRYDFGPASLGRTVLDKSMQGATFGFSDEVMDRIGALVASKYTGQPYEDILKEARGASKTRLKSEQEEHPIVSTAAELGGALGAPGAGVLKLLPKAAKATKMARIGSGTALGAGQGALMGAGQAEEGKRLEGAKTGAEFGAAGGTIGAGIGETAASALAPKFDKAVELLKDAGVKLTPGQLAKNSVDAFKRAEDFFKGTPLVGSMVRGGITQSLESFNKAVINKSLDVIGERLPSNLNAGREAIAHAEKAIGSRYDKLLPKLSFTLDNDFVTALNDFESNVVNKLPEAEKKHFGSLWDSVFEPRLDQNLSMTGKTFKDVESELSYQGRAYARSPDPSHKEFAKAVNEFRGVLRENLARMNPKYAAELNKINTAWAMFSRAQGASIRRTKSQGVFSPNDLVQDIKSSSTKGAFARGDGLLQDLAEAGNEVLPTNVPDSGTVERGLWATLLGGGAALNPKTAAVGAAASIPYTRPGMAVLDAWSNPSPWRDAARQAITPYAPAAGIIGSDLANHLTSGNQ